MPDTAPATMELRTLPEKNSFAWSVLEALVGQVETGVSEHGAWIRLTHVGGRRT